MAVFSHPDYDAHELVLFARDPEAKLSAIIAIHDAGPMGMAGGGCRMWPYRSDDEALADVLRLSRAMTYKLALADVPAGGAKAVIIGDPAHDKTEGLLLAFGRAVERLGGRYVAGEDVGTDAADMKVIAKSTSYVMQQKQDTSAATGRGVFFGLRTAVRRRLGRDLDGVKVAVQGLGHVGRQLAQDLAQAGAKLFVADLDPDVTSRVASAVGAEPTSPEEVLALDVDVVAPCALGGVLDERAIAALKCKVVAGGANNQLADPKLAANLAAREILYAPDFVINAGGVIGAKYGVAEDAVLEEVLRHTEQVSELLSAVFDRAERENVTTHEAAERMARERIAERRR